MFGTSYYVRCHKHSNGIYCTNTISSDIVLAPVLVNERAEFVLDVWVGGQQVRGTGEGQRGGVICSKEENEAV